MQVVRTPPRSFQRPLSASGQKEPLEQPVADYTILYYLNGDNDLREHVSLNLVKMDRVGVGSGTQAVAALFRGEPVWNCRNLVSKLASLFDSKLPSAVRPDWRGRKVYQVRGREPGATTREVQAPGGDRPSHPQSLREFLAWGMRTYPARHYVLVISGHGAGHRGILPDRYGQRMPIPELADAVEGGQKDAGRRLAVLALEGCSMGQVEVAYELRGCADYLLFSPEPLYRTAAPHDKLLDALASTSPTPLELVNTIVHSPDMAQNIPTATAVDLSRMEDMRQQAGEVIQALKEHKPPETALLALYDQARVYGPDRDSRSLVDLGSLARLGLAPSSPLAPEVRKELQDLTTVMGQAIVAHRDSQDPNRSGLSLYNPKGKPDRDYLNLDFPQESGWGDFIQRRGRLR
ncbi:MAG: clostripain-related cysteine peptidase [Candidatus Eremiobacterota bacterium]